MIPPLVKPHAISIDGGEAEAAEISRGAQTKHVRVRIPAMESVCELKLWLREN